MVMRLDATSYAAYTSRLNCILIASYYECNSSNPRWVKLTLLFLQYITIILYCSYPIRAAAVTTAHARIQ